MARYPKPRRKTKSKRRGPPAQSREVDISRLGRHGDGIAETDGGALYVAGALPGERVEALVSGQRGQVQRVIAESAQRTAPPCPHFGACGGCAVQHAAPETYRAWKRDMVTTALAHKGIDAPVADLLDAHGEGRRRVVLHAKFTGGKTQVGFMRPRSHDLLEIDRCPILTPALHDAPGLAAKFAARFAGKRRELDIRLTATESGLDVDLGGAGDLDYSLHVSLAELADAHDLARLTADAEVVVERRRPLLTIGGIKVTPPPGGFLQATLAGEAALGELIVKGAADAGPVLDLYCGVGPFALRLASAHPVRAVDDNKPALAALDAAVRFAEGLRAFEIERRDLAENPFAADELKGFDAVVFDPPRAGAAMQAGELARSGVGTVIAVSCDPASFARDAEILIGGGYALLEVTPVDQFRYAGHVEMVGLFRRP